MIRRFLVEHLRCWPSLTSFTTIVSTALFSDTAQRAVPRVAQRAFTNQEIQMSSRKAAAEFDALVHAAKSASEFAREVATAADAGAGGGGSGASLLSLPPALLARASSLTDEAGAAAATPHLSTVLSRPRVGVAAVFRCPELHGDAGRILVGARAGSHGEGRVATPGGHQEHGEEWATTAHREANEETGLAVAPERFRFLACTNDVMPEERLHYVTVFMLADVTATEAAAVRNTEPDKCAGWEWLAPEEIVARGAFIPLRNLIAEGHLSRAW
jgi:8-oxo-dGTP diphosphatase